jgi:ribonuclease HI
MIQIYCDGSTSSNGQVGARGGYGAVILYNEEEHHIYGRVSGAATNQICEIWAAIVGIQSVFANFSKELRLDRKIEIYSDSAYVVNCINDGWYKKWLINGWLNSQNKPVANKILWEKLIKLLPFADFTFIKVKGHEGNKYNEIADELARKGVQLEEEEIDNEMGEFS